MWKFFKALADLTAALRDSVAASRQCTLATMETNALLRLDIRLKKQLIALLMKILDRLNSVPDPGPLSLLVTGENGNMLNFKINLPPLPADATDIVSGELKLKIGEADEQTIATAKDQTVVDGLSGEQGARVVGDFAYLDDADPPNRSVHPGKLDVVLADTIPPADPGALSLEVTSETASEAT